jgi:hypothetical protein
MAEPVSRDLTEIFLSLQEDNRNVFVYQADTEVFFYRPLGRSEYKKIAKDERFTDFDREELFCQVCTLYPENYDFEDCDAGIPTELAKQIMKNSLLDSADRRSNVTEFFRQEMYDLDNQITCIINEAFPQFDIEDIDSWDVEKTAKYLSRAEWKLHNLRGLAFVKPQGEFDGQPQPQEQLAATPPEEEQTIRGGKKQAFTPEKLAEMKEKFPDIPWDKDTILTTGGIAYEHYDTLPPALRPGM